MDPPWERYPEPTCYVCDSYEVTRESCEDGAPLCDDHDTPIARKRVVHEVGLENAREDSGRASSMLHPNASGRKAEKLKKALKRSKKKAQRARNALNELREECDHADSLEQHIRVITEDDIPDNAPPMDLPAKEVYEKCWQCGHEDRYMMKEA